MIFSFRIQEFLPRKGGCQMLNKVCLIFKVSFTSKKKRRKEKENDLKYLSLLPKTP